MRGSRGNSYRAHRYLVGPRCGLLDEGPEERRRMAVEGISSTSQFSPKAEPLTARILLVDDHRSNLLALEAILEPLGQQLVFASSGQEALRHLLREDFAVILLD